MLKVIFVEAKIYESIRISDTTPNSVSTISTSLCAHLTWKAFHTKRDKRHFHFRNLSKQSVKRKMWSLLLKTKTINDPCLKEVGEIRVALSNIEPNLQRLCSLKHAQITQNNS